MFIEDAWNPRPSFVLNAGLRYDRFGAIGNNRCRPASPGRSSEEMSEPASAAAPVCLSTSWYWRALAFPEFPTRVVQPFDVFGAALGAPRYLANVVDGSLTVPTLYDGTSASIAPSPKGGSRICATRNVTAPTN